MRGLGWLRDKPDARDFTLETMRAMRVPARSSATPSLRHLRVGRLYQGYAGACFAFALARAIHMSLLVQGEELPAVPSPAFLYWNGRAQEYAGQDPRFVPITDKGTYPRLGMKATQKLGFCQWPDDPYDWRDVRTRPPVSAYMNAFDQRDFVYARIDGVGATRVGQVASALSAGYPVLFGMQVDHAYQDNEGEVVQRLDPANIVGGHMQVVLDVTEEGVGVDNWWGGPDERPWGRPDGTGMLSHDVFGSDFVSDVYAIIAAPTYSAPRAA